MSEFDRLCEIIAGEFEKVCWDRLTVDQKYRARAAANAVLDAMGIGSAEMAERMRVQRKEGG